MKIAILVDLKLCKESGGHVKYWERICESIKNEDFIRNLDLSIFFLGDKSETKFISKNINYKICRPIFSSGLLKFIGIDADQTDLFPFNPFLFFKLKKFDLIHTTDQFFSMSKTAKIASKIWSIPITTSIHTDTPPYTRYYVEKVLRNFFCKLKIDDFLINKLRLPNYFENRMFQKIYKYIKVVDHAMVADKIYSPKTLISISKNVSITRLNRGINSKIFFFKKEDKRVLKKKYNIPNKDKIIFFSGRIHELKGAVFLTKIHKELNAKGLSVTTLMAGEKIHEKKCLNITSEKINLLGYLPTTEIVKLYRICDLFIFPSNFEIGPNVVLEAKACRAVCVVSPNGGGKRIEKSGLDGIIINKLELNRWVNTVSDLLQNDLKRKKIRDFLIKQQPMSWKKIFKDDLLVHWERLKRDEEFINPSSTSR